MEFPQTSVLALTILLFSNLSLVTCQRRSVRGNQMVSSLLKNIKSPGNSDALALLKMASANCASPVLVENTLPSGVRPRSILPNNAVLPTNAILQSNAMLQTNGIINNRMTQNQKLMQQVLAQTDIVDVPQSLLLQQVDVGRAMPVTSPVAFLEKAPCPAPLVNPFLPAASPVSALAPPTSNLIPPADINNPKCTFLRKIPIPPPSL